MPDQTALPDSRPTRSPLEAVLFDGRDLDDALRSRDLRIQGDRDLARRLLGLYPAAEPLAVATP